MADYNISQTRDKVLFNISRLSAVINVLSFINDRKYNDRPEITALLTDLLYMGMNE